MRHLESKIVKSQDAVEYAKLADLDLLRKTSNGIEKLKLADLKDSDIDENLFLIVS